MVSFRRIVLALSILALFVGLAGAQTGTGTGSVSGGALTCGATVAVPAQLRTEGLTEQIGDIIISCTGGTLTTPLGGQVPTANITVSLQANVTSRILGSGNVSEALLFIDEPGSGEPGPGPAFPATLCGSAAIGAGVNGCTAFLGTAAAPGNGTTLAACTGVSPGGACTTSPVNVFQGMCSGNQRI